MVGIATKRVKTLARCEIFLPAEPEPAPGATVAKPPPLFYVARPTSGRTSGSTQTRRGPG